MSRSEFEPEREDPLQEQLVAYLDGELDPNAASELESQIALNPALRERMNRMEMAWGMLDYLPRAEVDESFTQSTLEMVAQKGAREEVRIEQDLLSRQRRRRMLLGIAGMVCASLLGFLAIERLWPDPNEQLLEDLPVLVSLDQYRHLDSIEYLRLLKERNVFPADVAPSSADASLDPAISSFDWPAATLNERRKQVESLSLAAKEEILSRSKELLESPPAEQERVRKLHHELEKQPDAPELRKVLHRYNAWLRQLDTPLQRSELLAMAPEPRVAKVEELRAEQEEARRRREEFRLSNDDVEAIFKWLDERFTARLEALPEAAPARQYLLLTAPQRRGAMREVLRLTSQPGSFRRPELTPESIEELKKRLSPEAQARLARREAEGGKPEQLIDWWIWQAARDAQRKYFDSLLADIPDQELAQFFETLPIKERNDLLDKWSEYGQAALKIKYLQKHLADKLPPILRNAEVGGGGFRRPPFEGSSRPGDGRRGGPGSGGGAGGASSGQRGGVTGSANPNGSGGTGGTRPPLPSESVDPPNRGD